MVKNHCHHWCFFRGDMSFEGWHPPKRLTNGTWNWWVFEDDFPQVFSGSSRSSKDHDPPRRGGDPGRCLLGGGNKKDDHEKNQGIAEKMIKTYLFIVYIVYVWIWVMNGIWWFQTWWCELISHILKWVRHRDLGCPILRHRQAFPCLMPFNGHKENVILSKDTPCHVVLILQFYRCQINTYIYDYIYIHR